MSLSNYPPGVSGNEDAIAGPKREYEDERGCKECGWYGTVVVVEWSDCSVWECEECGAEWVVGAFDSDGEDEEVPF